MPRRKKRGTTKKKLQVEKVVSVSGIVSNSQGKKIIREIKDNLKGFGLKCKEEKKLAHILILRNDSKNLKQLLSTPQFYEKIDVPQELGGKKEWFSPLQLAIYMDKEECARVLLENGANPGAKNIKNEKFPTALWTACGERDKEKYIDLLLNITDKDIGINVAAFGYHILTYTITKSLSGVEVLKKLITHPQIDINYQDSDDNLFIVNIFRYIPSKFSEILPLALEQGLDFNQYDRLGGSFLHALAIFFDRMSCSEPVKQEVLNIIAKEIKKRDIDVNIPWKNEDSNGDTPLMYAHDQSAEIFKFFLQKLESDPNFQCGKDKDGLIHRFVSNNEVAKLELLLGSPQTNVNLQNNDGCTPLCHYFALKRESANPAILKSLLENGADPNIRTYAEKFTPLMAAIHCGDHTGINLLLESGRIDPNILDGDGRAALLYSLYEDDIVTTMHLLDMENINVLVRDVSGKNILHYCMNFGSEDIVQRILRHKNCTGFLPNLLNQCGYDGNTPLDIAIIENKCGKAKILLDAGANINFFIQDKLLPLELAYMIYGQDSEMFNLLTSYGANLRPTVLEMLQDSSESYVEESDESKADLPKIEFKNQDDAPDSQKHQQKEIADTDEQPIPSWILSAKKRHAYFQKIKKQQKQTVKFDCSLEQKDQEYLWEFKSKTLSSQRDTIIKAKSAYGSDIWAFITQDCAEKVSKKDKSGQLLKSFMDAIEKGGKFGTLESTTGVKKVGQIYEVKINAGQRIICRDMVINKSQLINGDESRNPTLFVFSKFQAKHDRTSMGKLKMRSHECSIDAQKKLIDSDSNADFSVTTQTHYSAQDYETKCYDPPVEEYKFPVLGDVYENES